MAIEIAPRCGSEYHAGITTSMCQFPKGHAGPHWALITGTGLPIIWTGDARETEGEKN